MLFVSSFLQEYSSSSSLCKTNIRTWANKRRTQRRKLNNHASPHSLRIKSLGSPVTFVNVFVWCVSFKLTEALLTPYSMWWASGLWALHCCLIQFTSMRKAADTVEGLRKINTVTAWWLQEKSNVSSENGPHYANYYYQLVRLIPIGVVYTRTQQMFGKPVRRHKNSGLGTVLDLPA